MRARLTHAHLDVPEVRPHEVGVASQLNGQQLLAGHGCSDQIKALPSRALGELVCSAVHWLSPSVQRVQVHPVSAV